MSSKDLLRKLEFLAQQQVESAAKSQAMQESLLGLNTRTDSLFESLDRLTTRTDSLAVSVERLARKVDALVDIQAGHHTRMVRLEDSFVVLVNLVTLIDERLDGFEHRFSNFDGHLIALTERMAVLDATLSEKMAVLDATLSEKMAVLDTTLSEKMAVLDTTLTEKMAVLAAVQSHTDERLNTLINVVERYITNNGGAPK